MVLAQTTPIAAALQRENRTVPIVFVNVADPVGSGLVESLSRPGGNLTGLLTYEAGIVGKWLSMLKEIAPSVVRAGLLANPKTTAFDYFLRAAQAAKSSLAISIEALPVGNTVEIERAFETFARGSIGGLILPPDSTTILHRDLIVTLAAHDPQQRFIFIADGANGQIHTLAREDGKLLTQWGRHGRQPGQFKWVHNIAINSTGTIYTAEVGFGRRVQKFRPVLQLIRKPRRIQERRWRRPASSGCRSMSSMPAMRATSTQPS